MKVQFSSKRYLLIISICMIIGIYFLWPIISNDTQKIHVSDSSLVQTEMQTLGEESFDDTQLENKIQVKALHPVDWMIIMMA
ncbi:MAG: hypothetical protein IPJ92_04175 [Veillonella sp.]|nr:hypothetical protein [Veillonella sp.]